MARYLTVGHLLVEDVVLRDGTRALERLGGDAVYAAIGARAFADDVQMVVRRGRGFPETLAAELAAAGLAEGLIPSKHETIRFWIEMGIEDGARYTFQSGNYADATPSPDEIPEALAERLDAVHIAPVPFDEMLPLRRVGAVARTDRHGRPALRAHGPRLDAGARGDRRVPSEPGGGGVAARRLARPGGGGARARRRHRGDQARQRRARSGPGTARSCACLRRPATPVDPTGCGDAFCGGFLVGLAETGDLRAAMAHGTVAAGFVASDHGAAHALRIDRAEALERLASI